MKNTKNQFVSVPVELITSNTSHPPDLLIYAVIKSFMNYKTKIAFPSIDKIAELSELSRPTVIKSIENLETNNFISVSKDGRKNVYSFYEFDKFENYKVDFLKSDLVDKNEKALILSLRHYLFVNQGEGKTYYSDDEIAEKINSSKRFVVNTNKSLVKKGYLIELERNGKLYKLNELGAELILTVDRHDKEISANRDEIESLKMEIEQLKLNQIYLKAQLKEKDNKINNVEEITL